jgi:hypothetical protein
MADTREMITVHSDEILPIEYGPETHGISKPVFWGDNKRLFYVAPLADLERLGGQPESGGVWQSVFQIVSDHPDLFTREGIKLLEEARGLAGAGPA